MGAAQQPDLMAFELGLVDLAHRWRRVVDDQLRPLGLSQATWRTLYFVSQAGGEIVQKNLAFAIGIEGPSLVHLLDSLEKSRLIERKISSADRRAKAVHLTDAGKKQVLQIRKILEDVRGALLSNLSAKQITMSLDVFDLIKSNAEDFGTEAVKKAQKR
ncbi:MAG: MarR family transcriptional regulator [Proteobacteria bacterium]|nr:MarR family transcriptional regulator [Pseudomonadota bacterium]